MMILPLQLGLIGSLTGKLGEELGSTGLQEGGQAMTGWIAPMVNIGVGGNLISQVRKMKEIGREKNNREKGFRDFL
jgi:hypothetical protein